MLNGLEMTRLMLEILLGMFFIQFSIDISNLLPMD